MSLRHREEQLEAARDDAETQLEQRRVELPNTEEIVRYVADFRDFLREGTIPERKALIHNFVEGIEVVGDGAVLTYPIPISQSTPKTQLLLGGRSEELWVSNEAEVDETYIGGKERNKHESKRAHAGRGAVGKAAVVGMKDRETGRVATAAVESTDAPTLQGFVESRMEATAQVYTDEAAAYCGLARSHETVKHSAREYVHGMAHTNGIESHWAMLKRG